MRAHGLGDITPLNVPSDATSLANHSSQQSGWVLTNGWWVWTGSGTPNLVIPPTTGPGIPANSGWIQTSDGSSVWTGPGTQPNVIPPSTSVPITSGYGVPMNAGWARMHNGRHMWTGPGINPPFMPPGAVLNPGNTAQGPLHNWTRQPILPDSVLPPPLQRSNPLIQQSPMTPNKYDHAVITRAKKWQWVAAHGGLKSCCRIPEMGAPIYDKPPWQLMPSNAWEFGPMAALPISAFQNAGVFTGLDVEILNIRVPQGYDGVINKFVATTAGGLSGYNDFAGNIFWRLQFGIRFAKDLGNVQNTFGSFQNAIDVPGVNIVRVISGQTIRVFANVPPGSPINGGSIGAGVFGWFYPRR